MSLCELAMHCVANWKNGIEQNVLGYNLGTTAPKPQKWAIKPYQNDTLLKSKVMKFIIYIEPKKSSSNQFLHIVL